MTRLDRWAEPRHFGLAIGNPEANPALDEARRAAEERDVAKGGLLWDIVGPAKELVFQATTTDGPKFTVIGPVLDARHLDLSYSAGFEIFGFDGDDDVKETLAVALSQDVPVYPNDASSGVELARLHQDLVTNGFVTQVDGKPTRLKPVKGRYGPGDKDIIDVDITEIFPADFLLLQARERVRRSHAERAERTLAMLTAAINQLQSVLERSIANERRLQEVLTEFPILLGLDYRTVHPQYQLGGEYIMDYALERHSGLVDLLEIEASSHQLFTKSGNPRATLIHAEQQVLDWLDWIDSHGEYARWQHSGLLRPAGYVVIGRRSGMASTDERRLRRRNLSWHGSLTVETYDDVLDRARDVLRVLIANPPADDQGEAQ